MERVTVTNAKHRILLRLKVGGERTAKALAEMLGLTDVAVRQHLATLERAELVRPRVETPLGRGRPAIRWSITERASQEFPDRHAELTVGLMDAAREALGEDGLLKIITARADRQIKGYRASMPPQSASLRRKVEALARHRTAEGYMAEVARAGKGVYLLIEHHCPICEAARSCTGLCCAELRVFQEALGPGVSVERTKHLISGDERCVYRIRSGSRVV